MIGVQLTYLALDCFHSIGIEALLAFATELLEVHLKKKASSVSIETYSKCSVKVSKLVSKHLIYQRFCHSYKSQEKRNFLLTTLLLPEMHHT